MDDRLDQGRNFMNKLWNSARFILINVEDINHELPDYQSLHLTDKWIISKMHTSIQKIDKQYNQYKLNEVIKTIYEFVYDYFCDWYI